MCGAPGPPPRAHPQAWAAGSGPRGRGAWLPGCLGAGRGRARGRGRRAEPGAPGRAEVGRTDAGRKGSCIPRAAPPEANRGNGRRRPCSEPTPLLVPVLTMGMGQKESPYCGKVGGGDRFGTRVQGGGRGGNSGSPLYLLSLAFAVRIMEGLLNLLRLGSRVELLPPLRPPTPPKIR